LESFAGDSGCFVDARDGKKYSWVRIGDQIWMGQNLAYKTDSGCYAYKEQWGKIDKDGVLYNWSAAQKAPPKGWHLPSEKEYVKMLSFITSGKSNPRKLYDSIKIDKYGINFKYNGRYINSNDEYIRGIFPFLSTTLWTSTYGLSSKKDTLYSYFIIDRYGKRAGIKYSFNKKNALPIRCVKDITDFN